MSAIFGLLHRDGQPVASETLDRMGHSQAAYGRDSGGVWTRGNVGIGSRLTRFTPEDAFERQPLHDVSKRLTSVACVRLDNRPELAKELGIPATETHGMADSEFILQAYIRWGKECARRLIGAFTFAVYDIKESALLLVRSPRGEHSLYYWTDSRTFAFSSAPRGLFATGLVPRTVNLRRVADFLVNLPYTTGTSFYEGVQSLQPGHALWIRPEGIEMSEYWHADRIPAIRFRRDEEYVEAFNALWTRVVGDNLRSESPVGLMLSSGLDSTAIAASACEQLAPENKRLHGFTQVAAADFRGAVRKGYYPDESPLVLELAKMYDNLDTAFVHTDGSFYLDRIGDFLEAAEVPLPGLSNWVWYSELLRQCSERGIRVVHTGSAGNITISWAGGDIVLDLIRRKKWYRAAAEARARAKRGVSTSTLHALGGSILEFMPDRVWTAAYRLRHRDNPILFDNPPWLSFSAIRPEFAGEQKVMERAREHGHTFGARRGPRRAAALMRADLTADIGRASVAMFGVELRAPADDQRIVEFCLGIPDEQCARDGTTRWLIRRAMAGRLPAQILGNTERGYQAVDWFQRLIQSKAKVIDELQQLERSPMAGHALDLPRIRKIVESLPAPADNLQEIRPLRALVEISLISGRFLRWVESGG